MSYFGLRTGKSSFPEPVLNQMLRRIHLQNLEAAKYFE